MKRIGCFFTLIFYLFSIEIFTAITPVTCFAENSEILTLKKSDSSVSLLPGNGASLIPIGNVTDPVSEINSVEISSSDSATSDYVISEEYEISSVSSSLLTPIGGLTANVDSTYTLTITEGDTNFFSVTCPVNNIKARFSASTSPIGIIECGIKAPNGNVSMFEITGVKVGYATTTIEVLNQWNQVVASNVVYIHVLPRVYPTLKLSSYNKTMDVGNTEVVNATFSTLYENVTVSVETYDTNIVKAVFMQRNNTTFPISLYGVREGYARIKVYMRTTGGILLSQAELNVRVNAIKTPTLDSADDYAKMKVGESKKITFTVKDMRPSDTFAVAGTDLVHYLWDESVIDNKFSVLLKGRSAGSGSFTLYIKDYKGSTVAAETIGVNVTAQTKPAELSISPKTISVAENSTRYICINMSTLKSADYIELEPSSDIVKLTESQRTGDSVFVDIQGIQEGETTIKARLYENNALTKTATISVTVKNFFSDIENVAHIFRNLSGTLIDESICKYMFGDNEIAKSVHEANIGNLGICYGMASASALITENTNDICVNDFDRTKHQISQLNRQAYNKNINLTLFEFIQAMHIVQCAPEIPYGSGLSNMSLEVMKQLDQGIPVLINIFGTDPNNINASAGHALLACGYSFPDSSTMEIKVYDCNDNTSFKTLTLKGDYYNLYNSWLYPLSDSVVWGSTDPFENINYLTYDQLLEFWENRGSLGNENLNLFTTDESNFSIYNFDNTLMAKYQNGVLVTKADGVKDVPVISSSSEASESKTTHMLYLPIDYYTIYDESPEDGMSARLTNNELSVYVETEAGVFDLCAEDVSNAVGTLFTPQKDSPYLVSIGSSRDTDADNLNIKGYGMGTPIGVEMSNGQISLVGTETAGIGISNDTILHSISVSSNDGGTITSASEKSQFASGENCMYTITPDKGCVIEAVYVDGENVGAVSSYYFENITQSHNIYAEFKKDIKYCTIELSETEYLYDGTEKTPNVTVTASDGTLLTENEDYILEYSENTDAGKAGVYISAVPLSDYTGFSESYFTISYSNTITSASYNNSTNKITAAIENTSDGILIGAAYGKDNTLLAIHTKLLTADEKEAELDFSADDLSSLEKFKIFFFDSTSIPFALSKYYELQINQ